MDTRAEHFKKPYAIYEGNPESNFLKGKDLIYAPTQEEILRKGIEIQEDELRALYFYLYQSGARITEALKLNYGDVNIISKERSRYAEIRCITLKNRKTGVRMLPLPLYVPMEAQMFAYFNQIYEHRIGSVFKDQESRNNVWYKFKKGADKISFVTDVLKFDTKKIVKEEVALHPHLLRHFRLTHLVTLYNFTAFQLQQYAGWSSVLPASTYVSLGTSEIAEQFAKFRYTRGKVFSIKSRDINKSE